MPIRTPDPFRDPLHNKRHEVNRYLDLLKGSATSSLPALYGPALQPWAGRWRDLATQRMKQPPSKLVLEIGSHFGEVVLQMAHDFQDVSFLGMDITLKRVVKLAQKAEQDGLINLHSLLANARGIDLLFGKAELDGVLIFFPDPWAKKKRQTKHRLVDNDFLTYLAPKIRNDGFFWFKTDCEPYFHEVTAALTAQGWRSFQPLSGVASRTYISRFERLFRDQGLPIHESLWQPPLLLSDV